MSIRLFLGGSFDPVHDGHLQMIKAVHDRLSAHLPHFSADLSTDHPPFVISFLPTAGNPFKGKPTAPSHRLSMLDLACQLLKNQHILTDICPIEIHQNPPVYTIDTVRQLAASYPNDTRIFIMGGDSLAALPTWKNADEILSFTKIWAFGRVGIDAPISNEILAKMSDDFDEFLANAPIFYDKTPIHAISSTQIRHAITQGTPPNCLPSAILSYIKQHKLYTDFYHA